MNKEQLLQLLSHAKDHNKDLVIKGYVSSDGTVSDKIVKLLPIDGYKKLVEQSLEIVEKYLFTAPKEYTKEQVEEATKELKESFKKSLLPSDQKPAKEVVYKSKPTNVPGVYEDEAGLSISNLYSVSNTVLEKSASAKQVKSADKTIIKNLIKQQLPVDKYLGKLNLYTGKYKSIEVV